MSEVPFQFIDLPAARSRVKPRASGLTMMADHGLTLQETESLLRLYADFVDFAKIMTGTARLYPRAYLMDKLALYRRHQVRPFIGGQFAEYVFATQGRQTMPHFFMEAAQLGFATIEISDNCVPLTDEERIWLIRCAQAAGLSVLGEVGAKDAKSDIDLLLRQAKVCFEAGCELVLVEADELVENGSLRHDMIEALRTNLDMRRVMIELPGAWISGVTLSQVEDMKKHLVKSFGPDVNIANVKADTLMGLEALRVGLWTVGPTSKAAG
jgi:phosphosulfolactate synthase